MKTNETKLGKTWKQNGAGGGTKSRQNGKGSIAHGKGKSPGVRTPASR